MKVQLLVSEWCVTCHQAEKVWQGVAERKAIDFAVVDMGQPEGRELATRLRIRSIPALVVDGELKHVGLQTPTEALTLVARAPDKAANTARHIGIGLAGSTRAAILASAVYLFLAGGFLPLGGLFADSALRPLPLHLFTLGFLTQLIYGLGEHMLPRFMGNPIRMGALSWGQQALIHTGIAVFVAGYTLGSKPLILLGGGLAWVSFLIFTLRILPVLWSRSADLTETVPLQVVGTATRNRTMESS